MGSIEGAFIGLARYIRDHFPHLTWMPLWYGGIPFPDSYPPLLHATVAAVSGIGHISAGLAYHAATATSYSLGPVTLYWALRRMAAADWAAWIAAAGYSLFSPTLWLVPNFRHDIGGWFAPSRLDAMVSWGEGPHIAALTLLPLAIAALYAVLISQPAIKPYAALPPQPPIDPSAAASSQPAIKPVESFCGASPSGLRPGFRPASPWQSRNPTLYFLAALAMSACALSNWIGGFSLALVAAALLLAFPPRAWPHILIPALWAYAIAAPFFTPSTVATVQFNAPLVAAGGFKANHLLEAAFVAATLALAWALFNARFDPRFRFAILFLFFTSAITLLAYWFKLNLVPQPERYHLEMDLAFWLLTGLILTRIRLPRSRIAIAVAVGAAICLPAAYKQHRRARDLERPIAIASTAEYEISDWLGAHNGGLRVFAPGTIGFWMQAFSDTPMLTGGFDNGERNTFLPDVIYQIYAGDKQETMLAWAKAFGIGEIVGGWPQSREFYHPYAHPEKFAGLPEIWRDGPEVIYRVPRRRTSLAHAMLPSDLPRERPPAYYAKPLDRYLAALDDPKYPDASFTWGGTNAAVIQGNFAPDQVLSVQLTFDKGWRASVNGQPRAVLQDKLGQMTIEPRCRGACTVQLSYDGGLEQQAARWLSVAALGLGVFVLARELTRRAA